IGRHAKDGSQGIGAAGHGGAVKITIVAENQTVVGTRAVGVVEPGEPRKNAIGRDAENCAPEAKHYLRSHAKKSAVRVHYQLALRAAAAVGAVKRRQCRQRTVGGKLKHSSKRIEGTAARGCAIKTAVLAECQSPLRKRAVCSIE